MWGTHDHCPSSGACVGARQRFWKGGWGPGGGCPPATGRPPPAPLMRRRPPRRRGMPDPRVQGHEAMRRGHLKSAQQRVHVLPDPALALRAPGPLLPVAHLLLPHGAHPHVRRALPRRAPALVQVHRPQGPSWAGLQPHFEPQVQAPDRLLLGHVPEDPEEGDDEAGHGQGDVLRVQPQPRGGPGLGGGGQGGRRRMPRGLRQRLRRRRQGGPPPLRQPSGHRAHTDAPDRPRCRANVGCGEAGRGRRRRSDPSAAEQHGPEEHQGSGRAHRRGCVARRRAARGADTRDSGHVIGEAVGWSKCLKSHGPWTDGDNCEGVGLGMGLGFPIDKRMWKNTSMTRKDGTGILSWR